MRQPVTMTGMREVVAIADSPALAEGVGQVLDNPDRYFRTRAGIEDVFDLAKAVSAYEQLFDRLRSDRRGEQTGDLDAHA